MQPAHSAAIQGLGLVGITPAPELFHAVPNGGFDDPVNKDGSNKEPDTKEQKQVTCNCAQSVHLNAPPAPDVIRPFDPLPLDRRFAVASGAIQRAIASLGAGNSFVALRTLRRAWEDIK